MEEILIIIVQVVLEIFCEVALWAPWDIFLSSKERRSASVNAPLAGFISVALGILAGIITLVIYPKALFSNSILREVNLVLSPILMWIIADTLSAHRHKLGKPTDAALHRVCAICFSLSITLVRFGYAVRV